MRVFNDIDRWKLAGQRGGIDQRGQPPAPGIGIDLGQLHLGIGDAQQVIEQQQILGVCIRHPRAHPVTSSRGIQATHTEGCPQQPRHDMEGNIGGVRFAEGAEHLDTLGGGQRGDLTHEAALADSR